MRKYYRLLMLPLLLMLTLAACGAPGGETLEEEPHIEVPQVEKDGVTPLSTEELAFFSGDGFFNGDLVDNVVYYNIRNQFLSTLYDAPEQINLFELFYNGSGLPETITEAEMADVLEAYGEGNPNCPCTKNSRANMDAILQEHMGLSLAKTAGVGLERFVYLGEYDAYYSCHGDTNYTMNIRFYDGEREGELIRLFLDGSFRGDLLTLREHEGGYLFVSYQTL